MPTTPAIRPPRAGDAAGLADLATQLGYPTDAAAMERRLAAVAANDGADVLVAVDGSDRPVGWLHVELKRSLVAPLGAQIMGLVVDEGARSAGIGHALVRAAEEWARARGCHHVLVATRVTRERAHGFYLREGFGLDKTSHFFHKDLA
jgi:GNAT superfamily N-acetyltransferase